MKDFLLRKGLGSRVGSEVCRGRYLGVLAPKVFWLAARDCKLRIRSLFSPSVMYLSSP